MAGYRDRKMGEATLLHVRPPDPAGQVGGLSQVALCVVARASPRLHDAERHQRDGAHVVLGANLAYRRGRRRLEHRGNLAHRRAVVAAPARERQSRRRQHCLEERPALLGHLRRVTFRQGDVRGGGVE